MGTFYSSTRRAQAHRALDSIIDSAYKRRRATDFGPSSYAKVKEQKIQALEYELRMEFPGSIPTPNVNNDELMVKARTPEQRDQIVKRFGSNSPKAIGERSVRLLI